MNIHHFPQKKGWLNKMRYYAISEDCYDYTVVAADSVQVAFEILFENSEGVEANAGFTGTVFTFDIPEYYLKKLTPQEVWDIFESVEIERFEKIGFDHNSAEKTYLHHYRPNSHENLNSYLALDDDDE